MNSFTDGCILSVCTPSEGVHPSVLGVISSSSSLNVKKNIPGLFLLSALLGVISSSPTWKLETISLGACTPSVIFKVISSPSLQDHGKNIPGGCTLSAIYVIISSLPPWNMKEHLTRGVQPLVRYWECNYPLPSPAYLEKYQSECTPPAIWGLLSSSSFLDIRKKITRGFALSSISGVMSSSLVLNGKNNALQGMYTPCHIGSNITLSPPW